MDAERAAGSVLALMRALPEVLDERGWSAEAPGVLAVVTGLPLPSLNGVWVVDSCDAADIERLVDEVASRVDTYCLQSRPAQQETTRRIAERRRMSLEEDIPLMVADTTSLRRPQGTTDASLMALASGELDRHTAVAAAGFEAPTEIFDVLNAATAAIPGFRAYVAHVDGTDVSTAVTIATRGSVGVFSVATPPAHRRHGYGAVVTSYATECGLGDGADFAWLQASEAGFSVYEALGFRTVETWPMWVSTPA